MPKLIGLATLKSTEAKFILPNIRNYNRLEGTPRAKDFERNLRMEIRDPLWFLCRQWQFGEFQGEDAGTAYQANILGVHTKPERIVLANGQRISYEASTPLEMVVERESIDVTLFLRAQMGRHFGKILKANEIQQYSIQLLQGFQMDPTIEADDDEGKYFATSIMNLVPDGYKIYKSIVDHLFAGWYEHHPDITTDHFNAFAQAAEEFVNWFHTLYDQPAENGSAWVPGHLEYNFRMESKIDNQKKRSLIADQYASGHLDWKDFDQLQEFTNAGDADLAMPEEIVQTFIPTPLRFSGMPHPRLWQMEDNLTDFGKIDSSPTSILNLLLAEFSLTYSNDWFILPYELDINTICEIKGIRVTDIFDQQVLISPASDDPEMDWQTFAQFHQTERDNANQHENIFYLVPGVRRLMEGEDIENVNFIRDEMSNLVWAVEHIVPSESGNGLVLKRNVPSLDDFIPANEDSKIRYVLGNRVPDNWIPFLPVHKKVEDDELPKEIRLQRARMPQAHGSKSKIVSETQPVYFIEEEEVPRSGIIVSRNFQRTRWLNGKTFLWLGRRKRAGRGEGSANLMFDQLINIQ